MDYQSNDELEQKKLKLHAEMAAALNQEIKELELEIIKGTVDYLPRFDI